MTNQPTPDYVVRCQHCGHAEPLNQFDHNRTVSPEVHRAVYDTTLSIARYVSNLPVATTPEQIGRAIRLGEHWVKR